VIADRQYQPIEDKHMKNIATIKLLVTALAAAYAGGASALSFESEGGAVKGNLDSTVSVGVGVRAKAPGCDTVIGTNLGGAPGTGTPTGTSAGCLDTLSSYNDQGNLNYKKGQAFTEYVKGTHELLLQFPDDYKFMARVNWIKDFAATHTSGYVSGLGGEPLTPAAKSDLNFKARVLDLWVSKQFDLNGEQARLRVGNQVISWGESLFLPGGINQVNAMDMMRLSQPGTQLKEAMLPAPIASLACGLGHGVNVEAYVQSGWNRNYFPPVGSYWSNSTIGTGADQAINATPGWAMPTTSTPKNSGQYGAAVHYQPDGAQANFGLYAMRYHDKSPVAIDPLALPQYTYLQDRQLYGASVNFPLGNWAIGSELSYRPKDAVPLNPLALAPGTLCPDNKCFVEEQKYQLHVTGLLQLSPGEHGALLKLVGADSGMLLAEAAMVHYPNLQSSYQGLPVASGAWFWGALTANDSLFTSGAVPSVGSKTSWGYNFDFSLTYDGSLISGWQVSPEVYYFQAVKGHTPNAMALFMQGAKSANFIVTFTQNPANWMVGLNYAKFWGGDSVFDQPLRGRDFFGVYVSRNF
jgi:hypothetical protein